MLDDQNYQPHTPVFAILYFQIYGYFKLLIVKKVSVECCLFYLISKYCEISLSFYLDLGILEHVEAKARVQWTTQRNDL